MQKDIYFSDLGTELEGTILEALDLKSEKEINLDIYPIAQIMEPEEN